MLIYKITNKFNNKCYIGQTSRSVEIRWREHLKVAKYSESTLYRAIKKYGADAFTIKIVCRANSIEELNNREKFCIRIFKSIGEHGYNSQKGGKDHRPTPEVRQKIRLTVKKANCKPWLGKNLPDSIKQKISQTKIKKQQSNGVKNPMFGKKHLVQSIIKNAKSNGSKLFQVTKNNVIIGSWIVKAQCARDLGLSREQVRDCLHNKSKSAKGYTFRYL